jgi:hypothetical protein
LIVVTPTAATQNALEQREDRPKPKASVRLVAKEKRQYVDWKRCRSNQMASTSALLSEEVLARSDAKMKKAK